MHGTILREYGKLDRRQTHKQHLKSLIFQTYPAPNQHSSTRNQILVIRVNKCNDLTREIAH